jgi:hypothetical protein
MTLFVERVSRQNFIRRNLSRRSVACASDASGACVDACHYRWKLAWSGDAFPPQGSNGMPIHTVRPVASVRGHQGGRFYVNEHGAMFTPVDAGDGNGIDYIYCGQIDSSAWFPEPNVG